MRGTCDGGRRVWGVFAGAHTLKLKLPLTSVVGDDRCVRRRHALSRGPVATNQRPASPRPTFNGFIGTWLGVRYTHRCIRYPLYNIVCTPIKRTAFGTHDGYFAVAAPSGSLWADHALSGSLQTVCVLRATLRLRRVRRFVRSCVWISRHVLPGANDASYRVAISNAFFFSYRCVGFCLTAFLASLQGPFALHHRKSCYRRLVINIVTNWCMYYGRIIRTTYTTKRVLLWVLEECLASRKFMSKYVKMSLIFSKLVKMATHTSSVPIFRLTIYVPFSANKS